MESLLDLCVNKAEEEEVDIRKLDLPLRTVQRHPVLSIKISVEIDMGDNFEYTIDYAIDIRFTGIFTLTSTYKLEVIELLAPGHRICDPSEEQLPAIIQTNPLCKDYEKTFEELKGSLTEEQEKAIIPSILWDRYRNPSAPITEPEVNRFREMLEKNFVLAEINRYLQRAESAVISLYDSQGERILPLFMSDEDFCPEEVLGHIQTGMDFIKSVRFC